MIGPMQWVYIVIIALGVFEHYMAGKEYTEGNPAKQRFQAGTFVLVGLFLLILSVPIRVFG